MAKKPISEKSGWTLIYGKSSWKMQEDERARSLTGCCTATQIKLQVYEILMSHVQLWTQKSLDLAWFKLEAYEFYVTLIDYKCMNYWCQMSILNPKVQWFVGLKIARCDKYKQTNKRLRFKQLKVRAMSEN